MRNRKKPVEVFYFEQVAHVVLLSLGLTVHELAMTGGFFFSHAELAGPHSGVLFGITNTAAQVLFWDASTALYCAGAGARLPHALGGGAAHQRGNPGGMVTTAVLE